MLKKALVLLSLAALIPACSKTVEGESKRWTRNTQQIQKLSALYPGFAAPLKVQLATATTAMESAKKVSDKEAAAKAMSSANGLLSGGFVGKLSNLDGKIKKVQSAATTAATAAADKTDRMAARQVSDAAKQVVKEVKAVLKKGAKDVASAGAILDKADSDLKAAQKNLKTVIDAAKKKKESKEKVKEEKKDEVKKDEVKKEKAKAKWKCSYCDHMNDPAAGKCTECGAKKE